MSVVQDWQRRGECVPPSQTLLSVAHLPDRHQAFLREVVRVLTPLAALQAYSTGTTDGLPPPFSAPNKGRIATPMFHVTVTRVAMDFSPNLTPTFRKLIHSIAGAHSMVLCVG
jgi:hypothetical protein